MATSSIKVMNQSGDVQTYILFQESPRVQGVPSQQFFKVMYQTAPGIQSGHNAHALFRIPSQPYGVCGSNPDPLAIDHSVTTSNATSVNLTQGNVNGTTVFLNAPGNQPSWDDSRLASNTSANAFAIQTDANFTYPNESENFPFRATSSP